MKLFSVIFGMALAQNQASVTRLEATSLTNAATVAVSNTWHDNSHGHYDEDHLYDGDSVTYWVSGDGNGEYLTSMAGEPMYASMTFNEASTVTKVGFETRPDCCHDKYANICFRLFDDAENELTTPICTTGAQGQPLRVAGTDLSNNLQGVIETPFPYVTNVKRVEIRYTHPTWHLHMAEVFVDVADCPNAGWEVDSNGVCQSPCINDAWQTDANGNCQPDPTHFRLECTASGMNLNIDDVVFPDGEGITLDDSSCAGTKTGNTWTISTALDSCQTAMAVDDSTGVEKLAFSNKVKFNAFSANAEIYTQNQVVIDFTCNYDSTYDDIEVTDVTVVSENVDADSQDQDGLFDFGLVQYMDSGMTDQADADDQTPLGGTMYFQLTFANPVAGLDWVIRECVVVDDALSLSYTIIDAQCPDTNLQVQTTNVGDPKSAINFSYIGFKFTQSVDNQQTAMKIRCSVTVCDANDSSSTCNFDTTTC